MKKTGLVVEGGGMRGIYAAGVLDRFLDTKTEFDYCIGVSSGSADLASFLAKQKKRNYRFFHEYGHERRFLSLENYLLTRNYFGLDYIYGTVTNSDGKDPLDIERLQENPAEYECVATEYRSGKAHYFNKSAMQPDHYECVRASSSLPVLCRPVLIDGVAYCDGGVADPVPVVRALASGCDFLVVVLSKAPGAGAHSARVNRIMHRGLAPWPKLLAAYDRMDALREAQVRVAQALQREGRAVVLYPDRTFGVKVATRDKAKLDELYAEGQADALRAVEALAVRKARPVGGH